MDAEGINVDKQDIFGQTVRVLRGCSTNSSLGAALRCIAATPKLRSLFFKVQAQPAYTRL